MQTPPALLLDEVSFAYGPGAPVLAGASLRLEPRERALVVGPSGSGKSTLLNLVCGTLVASSGTVAVAGTDLAALSPGKRDRMRAREIGVVFQQFNLVPYLSVLENVLLPARLSGRTPDADRARELLDALELEPALTHTNASRLSVGQQQRVAVARAFLPDPALVIADEPTSALDPQRRDRFLSLLLAQAERTNAAVLLVTHDESLSRHIPRVEPMDRLNGGRA